MDTQQKRPAAGDWRSLVFAAMMTSIFVIPAITWNEGLGQLVMEPVTRLQGVLDELTRRH